MKKDLLSLADLSPQELHGLLQLAAELKAELQGGGNQPLLQGKVLGMIFQKPSLRTRVSFEVGMLQLGGHALYLSPNEIQLGVRESVADVAQVMGRYVDGIMARVFAHRDVELLAQHAPVPVINGLSDLSHPCQGLADLFTVFEKRGRLQGRKLAWVGDGNNVCHSLLLGTALLGMDMAVATPPGYEPKAAMVEKARGLAKQSGSTITLSHDPREAVRGADVIYTDVWASMGQEAEVEQRQAIFRPFQVNAALVAAAKADVLVMHCLPAHRGQEITDEVMDGPHSVVYDQAENRMHAQKALLVRLLADNR
jgi:ornithine carbamoyltransferase